MKPTRYPAFTLIELLVVIVIIGILAVIVAPDYLRFRQQIDLKNSVSLLQAGLNEGYSLARSRSRHFEVSANAGAPETFQVEECIDFGANVGIDGFYDCSDTVPVLSASGNITQAFEGNTQVTSGTFRVRFLAPHGDMEIIGSTDNPLTITLENNTLSDSLYLYQESGLITTDTP